MHHYSTAGNQVLLTSQHRPPWEARQSLVSFLHPHRRSTRQCAGNARLHARTPSLPAPLPAAQMPARRAEQEQARERARRRAPPAPRADFRLQ